MDYIEVSGKTLDDAITVACQKLEITSNKLEY
ncbi:protein jag, partial [bacterium 1XD42-8]